MILTTLLEKIDLVPFNGFKHEFSKAVDIMRDIDITDSAFIAVALALEADGVWTEDKDFLKQNAVRLFSTGDPDKILNGSVTMKTQYILTIHQLILTIDLVKVKIIAEKGVGPRSRSKCI